MKVTLKDIAADTGYSISTISRVLNGSDKISTKTRKKVFDSAKKLNYPIYNISLNGDNFADTLKVSLILTSFHTGEFYASFFHGINESANKQNIQLSLVSLPCKLEEILKTIKELSRQKEDGLILFAPELTPSDYKKIPDILPDNYPFISNGLIENPVFPSITFDGYSGGFLVAEHFQNQGYESCGLIHGPLDRTEARHRANGFRDYIIQAGNMDLIWEHQGDYTFESGKEAFKAFEETRDKPRAIFASNDAMCHSFIEEALMHGYDVPGDIALAGYDDLPICTRHRPAISSVHTDYQKLGHITLEKLKDLLSNPQQERGILSLIPVSFVKRESS